MATININGDLILDQTAGLQTGADGDDVEVFNNAGTLVGDLDSGFESFLNNDITLTDAQKDFADLVEGASQPGLVEVVAGPNETIKSLFFSDASGNDFDGDLVPNVTTLSGDPLYFWSMNGGTEVIVTTGGINDTVVAAFYIESENAANTSAKVESITFQPLLHTDTGNPDDRIDFSDVLNVSASVVTTAPIGGDIGVDDDGPTIVTTDNGVNLTVDETLLNTTATADFSGEFDKDFGTDGGTQVDYVLGAVAGPSGLVDTLSGQDVILSVALDGSIEGRTETDDDLVFSVSVDADGKVTLDQSRAVVHPTLDPDEPISLADDSLITLTATITDADGDTAFDKLNIGQNMIFEDDGPSISPNGTPPVAAVDETDLGVAGHANYGPLFTKDFGSDGEASVDATTFSLDFGIGATGLVDEETGGEVSLSKIAGVIYGKNLLGDTVFTISVDDTGDVVFTQLRSVTHDPDSGPDQTLLFASAGLITLTATITDGDGDKDSTTLEIGKNFSIDDDTITLTIPVGYKAGDTFAELGNQAGQTYTAGFGYDIGADDHTAAYYLAGGSDFVDVNPNKDGVQISLTGTTSASGAFLSSDVTLQTEDAHQATFNWSFTYDKDPITAGTQLGTTSGTLVFNKDADTYTLTDTTPVEGFSFDVLHTAELTAKEPTGNTGHPNIVVEQLSGDVPGTPVIEPGDPFFVQFTANSTTNSVGFITNSTGADNQTGNTAWVAGEFVANSHADWVSATQTTNGVAGDTIQKGELLTLRFFQDNPHIVNEPITPTEVVSAVALKFDGIGNSEDLLINLDLIDYGANGVLGGGDDTHITRMINIENQDIYKASTPGGVPAPWTTEFPLDNNDGLVIIESNDYNLAGEHYQIQGMQIMQSANGLTGDAFDFNKALGAAGGATGVKHAFDPTDNDVLKIVDIGFVQTTSGTQTATMDFAFNLADGDLDLLGVQHINAQLSTGFIV